MNQNTFTNMVSWSGAYCCYQLIDHTVICEVTAWTDREKYFCGGHPQFSPLFVVHAAPIPINIFPWVPLLRSPYSCSCTWRGRSCGRSCNIFRFCAKVWPRFAAGTGWDVKVIRQQGDILVVLAVFAARNTRLVECFWPPFIWVPRSRRGCGSDAQVRPSGAALFLRLIEPLRQANRVGVCFSKLTPHAIPLRECLRVPFIY